MTAATSIKQRPIIFSGEMVRAILDGRKTQTRRVVKPQPAEDLWTIWKRFPNQQGCPYGKVGDRLWVRETWCPRSGGMLAMDRVCKPRYRATEELRPEWGFRWRASIHMPRWASRLDLEIAGIRVQRVQDVREQDAIDEGVHIEGDTGRYRYAKDCGPLADNARLAFRWLWESIHGEPSWLSNPWVWAVTFKMVGGAA